MDVGGESADGGRGVVEVVGMKPKRKKFGSWRFNPDNWTLELVSGCYYVDLDRCCSSVAVLDWICQIAHKRWATDKILADLVRALDDLLTPQVTLCSWGMTGGRGGSIDPRRVVAESLK